MFPGITEAQIGRVVESIRAGSTVADSPINDAPYRTLVGVEFGDQVVVQSFTNLYGCSIGDNTRIGPFVEFSAER